MRPAVVRQSGQGGQMEWFSGQECAGRCCPIGKTKSDLLLVGRLNEGAWLDRVQ